METTAIVRGVRLSAQKGRLVADLVRGKPVDKALAILTFTQKRLLRCAVSLPALRAAAPASTSRPAISIFLLATRKLSKGVPWVRKLIPPASVFP